MAALLVALFALPSGLAGQTAGTVTIVDAVGSDDEVDWVSDGTLLTVRVEDPDLDTPHMFGGQNLDNDATMEGPKTIPTGAPGSTYILQTDVRPILNSMGSPSINSDDVLLEDVANGNTCGPTEATCPLTVLQVDSANGTITIRRDNFGGFDWNTDSVDVRVGYFADQVNEIPDDGTVTVSSQQTGGEGVAIELTEDADDPGVFYGQIQLVSTEPNADELQVGPQDTVTATYADNDPSATRSDSVPVETTGPSISALEPPHNTSTQLNRPEFAFETTDSESGIDADDASDQNIRVRVEVYVGGNTGGAPTFQDTLFPNDEGFVDPITGGYRVTQRLPGNLAPNDSAIIWWWVEVTDEAGNTTVTDQDLSTEDEDDPFVINVDFDQPQMINAVTGDFNDDGEIGNNNVRMVRVEFNEPLDPATVSASDFRVAGNVPSAADVYPANDDEEELDHNVFLTLSSDLAASARPEVELVSSVSDLAGNSRSGANIANAQDGIDPTLTVQVNGTSFGSRPVTDETVTVRIESNETVQTPQVSVRRVGQDPNSNEPGNTLNGDPAPVSSSIRIVGTRTWEVAFTPTTPGLYNVYVTANDTPGGNPGSSGTNTDVDDDTNNVQIDLDDANLVEVDHDVAEPDWTPMETTSSGNPYILVDFRAGEGMEYGLDSDMFFTDDPEDVVTDFDTFGNVTIVSSTLDGESIDLTTLDNTRFSYVASGLGLGEHTLAITVQDQAGNEEDFEHTFEVTERAPVTLTLTPGLNLISFPEPPLEPGINDVLPANTDIDVVLGYNPMDAAPWKISQRNPETGMFGEEAEIKTIEIGKGYWVRADRFTEITYDAAPFLSPDQSVPPTPPQIRVTGGEHNLVGFVSLTGALAAPADSYFNNIDWQVAYTYTLEDGWVAVRNQEPFNCDVNDPLPGDEDCVVRGQGYMVFAAEDGWILP